MDTLDIKRSMRGRQSRENGLFFESMILDAARFYESKGISVIDKTPEPMKIISVQNRKLGRFVACFAKQAQPDFKGILMDSTMVLFDAKHTDQGKLERSVVSEEQERCFERYMKLGAICFVVVSLGFESYYRIPWVVFRDMKKIYGRKHMKPEEMEPYKIKYANGTLKFLEGLELREKEEI